MDENTIRIGSALWREDLEGLGVALRECGAWPDGAERVFGGLSPEEILQVVAIFVVICRDCGWPERPTGAMVWAAKNRAARGVEALAMERRRRDMRTRDPVAAAALAAFMGVASPGEVVAKVPEVEVGFDLSGLGGRRPQ